MKFETKAIHAGGEPDEATAAIAPPIHLSTTFERTADSQPTHGFSYVREANPTQSRLEEALAAIESGAAALAFSSGMAAGAAIVQALPGGSHIVLTDDSYYAYRVLARDFLGKWGISVDLADFSDPRAVERLIRPATKLIWAESPSNPLMKIADLVGLSTIAGRHSIPLLVDNTFASPVLQRPIEQGADVVLHSTTKYIGGHSDVQGGALVFKERGELFEATAHTRRVIGGVASPFNSWLVLRGIRSLAARMRVHCENAHAVARFLSTHPRVERVHYPGLTDHPGYAIAAKQMSDFGGMLSFRVRGGREEAIAVVSRARLFTSATSLGGVESLIEHRASSEGEGSTTPQNLLRLSIGLEHPDDLVNDLRQALG